MTPVDYARVANNRQHLLSIPYGKCKDVDNMERRLKIILYLLNSTGISNLIVGQYF